MTAPAILSLLDALAQVGAQKDLDGFRLQTATAIQRLVPCESTFCCVVEAISFPPFERASLVGVNLPEDARRAYLERYCFMDPIRRASTPSTIFFCEDWRRRSANGEEFATDFIHGILHVDLSAGLLLMDPSIPGGTCFGLTRTGVHALGCRDEEMLLSLRPHLVNYYSIFRKLERPAQGGFFAVELARENRILSKRQAEITELLCRRLSPSEIARCY